MEPTTRSFMESRFRYDFSGVRIFHDDTAAASARSVFANAYTVGEKIVFNQDRYAPDSQSGRRLLAHAHKRRTDQGLQLRLAFDRQLTAQAANGIDHETRGLHAQSKLDPNFPIRKETTEPSA